MPTPQIHHRRPRPLAAWAALRLLALAAFVALSYAAQPEGNDRRPTLFVPGLGGSSIEFDTLRVRLESSGFPSDRLHYVHLPHDKGGNRADAAAIAAAVDRAVRRHRTDRVNLVAHSMGNLAVRWYVGFMGGERRVHTWIALGAMHHGLPPGGPESPCSAPPGLSAHLDELCSGSPFILQLRSRPPAPPPARVVSIWSRDDEVVPPWSSHLPGATINVELRGPKHGGRWGLLEDRVVFERMLPWLAAP